MRADTDTGGRELTLGSLFDGSGGFPLGAILAGIEPKWASEVEPFPIRVTTKRLPSVKHLGDIHRIHGDEIEPVDNYHLRFSLHESQHSRTAGRAAWAGVHTVL